MRILLTGILSLVLCGCSSIVSKSEYAVSITSHPNGAEFEMTNLKGQRVYSGVTPTQVILDASSDYFTGEKYTINISKQGLPKRQVVLESQVDDWYIGNLLFGGLLGMLIVDPATGAMYQLPDRFDVTLDLSASEDVVTAFYGTKEVRPPKSQAEKRSRVLHYGTF